MSTLPTDSTERKHIPMNEGVLKYFPAALAGVARISKAGNDKHNPGQPLHHARSKSSDHADCIIRHLIDVNDILRQMEYHLGVDPEGYDYLVRQLGQEASQLAWRALALSQEIHETYIGVPVAPGARLSQG